MKDKAMEGDTSIPYPKWLFLFQVLALVCLLRNAKEITVRFRADILFAAKEEKPNLAGQMRLFLTPDAGERSSQKRKLLIWRS